ncbi:MAG: asparagine synthase (glutamine-hydrolyzing) [Pseudomonadota bacterium]
MCGIFGYIGKDEVYGLLCQMGNALSHRGPDDAGYYVNNADRVNFGMRRLSIIDLEGGHQPLSNEENTVWIACNGEIYNYLELRGKLTKKGHLFRTKSDVEVLVHLYEEHGLDFLKDVNGMFGLALYDVSINRLILVRDRIGIKPLYYSWDGKNLAFASEIKPLLLCPWINRTPDWQAISAYLNLLFVPSPKTGFEEIKKLESGTMAILEEGILRFKTYWDINTFLENDPAGKMSFEDASEHLQYLLKDACRLQLRSDVPVGAFLSGGLDSSAVVALSNVSESLDMDTFTVFWEDAPEKMDERPFAKDVAERYGCAHHETSVSYDDFDRLLPLLVWHMEEPNADGAYVPTYVISSFARQKAKVILTGAGGDELFAGYGWYYSYPLFKRVLRQLMTSDLWHKHAGVYTGRAFNFPWALVLPSYQSGTSGDFLGYYSKIPSGDELNAQMAMDLKYWLQDDVLLLTDKMSMAASLEARVPLLDHRIVEFVLGLPSAYKIMGADQKIIFKKAMGQYLPDDILRRRKDGFGAPINSWAQRPLMKNALDLLERGELMKQGIIDKRSLRRLKFFLRLKKEWVWALWILLNLELWFQFVQKPSSRPDGIRLSEL